MPWNLSERRFSVVLGDEKTGCGRTCKHRFFVASRRLWFPNFFAKRGCNNRFSQQPNHQRQKAESIMATKNFEVQQLFKAYRSGVITEDFFSQQMDELVGAGDEHAAV